MFDNKFIIITSETKQKMKIFSNNKNGSMFYTLAIYYRKEMNNEHFFI